MVFMTKDALNTEAEPVKVIGIYPEFRNAIKVRDDKGREGIYTRADLVTIAERAALLGATEDDE